MSINNENYLSISDFHKICRTCASKNDLKHLYENSGFVEMLQFCTMIQFDENDNLPKQICQTCISDLNHSYKFTNKCKTIDAALKKCVIDYENIILDMKTNKDMLEIVANKIIIETKSNIEVRCDKTDENKTLIQNFESVYIVKNEPENIEFDNIDDVVSSNVQNDSNEVIETIEKNERLSQNIEVIFIKNEPDEIEFNKIPNDSNKDPDYIEEANTSCSDTEDEIFELCLKDNRLKFDTTDIKQKDLPFKCTICKKSFAYKQNLKVHLRTHSTEKPYQCDVCNKLFRESMALNLHYRNHTGERPYECDICQKSYIRSGDLMVHKRVHTNERSYKCDICQRGFNRKQHMIDHKRIHNSERPYKCDICHRTFTQSSSVVYHMRTHTGESPFKCDVCQKSFKRSTHLTVHKRIHSGERPYKCDICPKSFCDSSSLMVHKRIHSGERPFKCGACQKSFSQSCNLMTHIKTVHSIENR